MTKPLKFNQDTYLLTWDSNQFNLKNPVYQIYLTDPDDANSALGYAKASVIYFTSKILEISRFHIWTPILDGIELPSGTYTINIRVKDQRTEGDQWTEFPHQSLTVNLDTSEKNRPKHPCQIPELHYLKGKVYPEVVICTQLRL